MPPPKVHSLFAAALAAQAALFIAGGCAVTPPGGGAPPAAGAAACWNIPVHVDPDGLWIADAVATTADHLDTQVPVRVLIDTGYDGTLASVRPSALPSLRTLQIGSAAAPAGRHDAAAPLELVDPPGFDTRTFAGDAVLSARADLVMGSALLRITPPVTFELHTPAREEGGRAFGRPFCAVVPLTPPPPPPPPDGPQPHSPTPPRRADPRPYVRLDVDGTSMTALVDTGTNARLTLPGPPPTPAPLPAEGVSAERTRGGGTVRVTLAARTGVRRHGAAGSDAGAPCTVVFHAHPRAPAAWSGTPTRGEGRRGIILGGPALSEFDAVRFDFTAAAPTMTLVRR